MTTDRRPRSRRKLALHSGPGNAITAAFRPGTERKASFTKVIAEPGEIVRPVQTAYDKPRRILTGSVGTTEGLRDRLADFVEGRLSLEDLETALDGLVRFRYADRDERMTEGAISSLPSVKFQRLDVERALQRFLRGEVSRREVSDWAATLRLVDAFELDEVSSGASEVVWDVLDQLMSPDAWDELTSESAIDLLSRLA